MNNRINKIFSKDSKKLATFVTGGDPDLETSKKIIEIIAENGADIIEIGMPFSDPMADGPTIQSSSSRAIKQNISLDDIFLICKNFRTINDQIPIILMGYYNIVYHYGVSSFVDRCLKNGVDGLIIVDLQPEEDSELLNAIESTNLDLIRLVTPTTNDERLSTILKCSSGFLYYVTITGITGQNLNNIEELNQSINQIKQKTSLPIISGFGIKNVKQVRDICQVSDGVVVGSSIVKLIEDNLNNNDKMLSLIANFIKQLKEGTKI